MPSPIQSAASPVVTARVDCLQCDWQDLNAHTADTTAQAHVRRSGHQVYVLRQQIIVISKLGAPTDAEPH